MPRRVRPPAGFSLTELLLVVTLIGIFAAVLLPNANPSLYDRLQGAAHLVSSDLAYARGLAVMNNSTYRVTFDFTNNRYVLQYSGANPALNTLPFSPFRQATDLPTQQTTDFRDLPGLGSGVSLAAVGTSASSAQPLTQIEFGPLGQTTQTAPTVIWLSAGKGTAQRYISLSVNPVTGLADVKTFQGVGPPQSILPSGS
jgi:prepilin-type N-terminal cleavage/methylation domain-containing protein